MSMTTRVIWRHKEPDLFRALSFVDWKYRSAGMESRFGRIWMHGILGEKAERAYIADMERELPFHGNSQYAGILRSDIKLAKLALEYDDICLECWYSSPSLSDFTEEELMLSCLDREDSRVRIATESLKNSNLAF